MIRRLAISGYRSLRDLRIELGQLNVVTGANGSGKSSLYRALRLLADVAQGRVVQSLAAEGGLSSMLWAGPEAFSRTMKRGELPIQGTRRKNPVSLRLGFSGEDYGYAIDLGLPQSGQTMFSRDPEIKAEALWTGEVLARSNVFASRAGPAVRTRNRNGEWQTLPQSLSPFESMMPHAADPYETPGLLNLRERMQSWCFYDHLRTDRDAPARKPQVGTCTPVLADDGRDLAAGLQTICEIGDGASLEEAVEDAFPGASIDITEREGLFDVEMAQHGLLRPLKAAELSDGTLRYLLLCAALLSPTPATLTVLNEPETSLHSDLLSALAGLIVRASCRSQIVVVTHAAALGSALASERSCREIVLEKELGETIARADEPPPWTWPTR